MTARGPIDPRLLRHARTSRPGLALLAGLGVGQALTTIVIIVAVSRIVVALAGRFDLPVGSLGLLVGGFLVRALLSWAEQVVAQRTAARVAQELRAAVLAAALRRGPAWVAEFGTGRLAALLGGGLDALRPWFAGYLPALVPAVALPPLVVLGMAVVDRSSAVIAVLTLPLVPVFGWLIGTATRARAQESWDASARLAGHFLDVVRGLATLRLYGRAERQITVVEEMTERHRAATLRVLRIAFLSSTALDLVATLSVGLIAVEAGLRVAAGRLDLGSALLVILLAPEAYRPLREVGARFHAGADATAVVTEVDAVLAGAPSTDAVVDAGPPSLDAMDLRVRHPGNRADALDLPSLRVHAGEFVALAGPSGAGKTTALRALAGVQPLTAGRVESTGPRALYLPQHPTLPHARTVAEALAVPSRAADISPFPGTILDDEPFAALAAVGLVDEIRALPDGLATPLGEHGRGLSSGQRQRLALARVLREAEHSRPLTLLLDEPTAHLDAVAERRVIEALRALADRGCAVIVVAHRPALLAAANRIVDLPLPKTIPLVDFQAPDPHGSHPIPAGGMIGEDSVQHVGRTLPNEPARSAPWVAVGFGVLSGVAGVVLTGAAAWLLVRAATMPPVLTLSTAVVIVRGSAVIRPLARYLERLNAHGVAFARLGRWRAEVFADLVPRVPGVGLHRRGELLGRIVEDVDARVDGLLRGRLPAAASAVTLAAAGLVALALLPSAALALGAGLIIAAGVAPALAGRQALRREEVTVKARAELADAVVETVEGLDELAGRGVSTALRVPVDRGRALARIEAHAARSAGTALALAHLGLGLAVVGTALALAAAVDSGRVGAEVAAVLLLGVVALAEPVLGLPDAAIARRRATAAQTRLTAVRSIPRSIQSPSRIIDPDGHPGDSIVVRGLVAGWDPARPPGLTGLDLELPAGSRIAIVGPSGGGKSTLAAVLAGLLDPIAGTVGQAGQRLALAGVRVALVGDEVDHVFASTLRENLRLARPTADDQALIDVLNRVRLGDWLTGLPAGLDTWLGEGGSTMSGGERRRLVTARALLTEPDLLVLDEPTEGLDEPTARALMADLLAVTVGRRVLLLTHRQEGLDQVDSVHELSDGRLRSLMNA